MTRLDTTHDEEIVQHVHNTGHPGKPDHLPWVVSIALTRLPLNRNLRTDLQGNTIRVSMAELRRPGPLVKRSEEKLAWDACWEWKRSNREKNKVATDLPFDCSEGIYAQMMWNCSNDPV